MASWEIKQASPADINKGNKFNNGDSVGAEDINNVVQAALYAQQVERLNAGDFVSKVNRAGDTMTGNLGFAKDSDGNLSSIGARDAVFRNANGYSTVSPVGLTVADAIIKTIYSNDHVKMGTRRLNFPPIRTNDEGKAQDEYIATLYAVQVLEANIKNLDRVVEKDELLLKNPVYKLNTSIEEAVYADIFMDSEWFNRDPKDGETFQVVGQDESGSVYLLTFKVITAGESNSVSLTNYILLSNKIYEHYYTGQLTLSDGNKAGFAIAFLSKSKSAFATNESLFDFIKLSIGGKKATGFVAGYISNITLIGVNTEKQLKVAGISLAGSLLEIVATTVTFTAKVVNEVK